MKIMPTGKKSHLLFLQSLILRLVNQSFRFLLSKKIHIIKWISNEEFITLLTVPTLSLRIRHQEGCEDKIAGSIPNTPLGPQAPVRSKP